MDSMEKDKRKRENGKSGKGWKNDKGERETRKKRHRDSNDKGYNFKHFYIILFYINLSKKKMIGGVCKDILRE